jgi:hypothetical protein
MSAASTNSYDIYSWILKNMESCKTQEQLKGVEKLISNWRFCSGLKYDITLYRKLHSAYYDKKILFKKLKKNDTIQLNS